MNVARYVTTCISCLILAGCSDRGAVNPTVADGPQRAAHPRPAPTAPDLRIPASAVASNQDIPLVPVPPIPLGKGSPTATEAPRPNVAPAAPSALPPVPGSPGSVQVAGASDQTAPPAAAATETSGATLRQLQQQAAAWYASVDSYIVRITRREVVAGEAKPEEIMLLKFRKDPWSIHFKWVGKVGHGREVLYVKGQYENQLHTRLAAGDIPLMPAGMKLALALDSPQVRSASRHPVTDAGLGACIDHLTAALDAQDRGDRNAGAVRDLGLQKRPEFSAPVRGVEVTLPPGLEAELPKGGRRFYYFDPDLHLPTLVLTYDERNQEVEYYHYDRLMAPVHLDADDFNPDKLWTDPRPAAKAQ
jgi:hypothetical protein